MPRRPTLPFARPTLLAAMGQVVGHLKVTIVIGVRLRVTMVPLGFESQPSGRRYFILFEFCPDEVAGLPSGHPVLDSWPGLMRLANVELDEPWRYIPHRRNFDLESLDLAPILIDGP